MTNDVYDRLKSVTTIVLPALAVFYFGLAEIWESLPDAADVVGTLALVSTFLGVVLKFTTKQYWNSDAPFDGDVSVGDGQMLDIILNEKPSDAMKSGMVILKPTNREPVQLPYSHDEFA